MKAISLFTLLMLSIPILSCQQKDASNPIPPADPKLFNPMWYAGKAEVTSYTLNQARYGEIHEGEAVLIFVTEDFSKQKQVKLDRPNENKKDVVSVLKMNATRQFNTGIYQYNQMQSVFTPVSYDRYPRALKVTASSQDWCGQSFMQYNWDQNGYKMTQLSYFESEGDQVEKTKSAMMEDEIWTKIRIAPHTLPVGKFQLIPSLLFARNTHSDGSVANAIGQIEILPDSYIYQVQYTQLNRKLRIEFSKTFPYEIESWEEEIKSGFGKNAKVLSTKGIRRKSLMVAYWEKHDVADLDLRKQLELKN